MDNKQKRQIIAILAIAAAALFIIFLVIGIVYSGSAFTKTVLILIAVVSIAFALLLGYLYLLSDEVVPNYFLFNPNTNRNIPVSKLTFQAINVRMNRYLANYATSEGKVWTDKVLDAPALDMADVYKPLVAYKLLFDLAERDFEAGWKCFELASAQTVEFIAAGLEMNGDGEFAKALRKIKNTTPVSIPHIRDLLIKNKRYLQGRMYKYTTQNIDKF